jgi:hypothetical protein
MKTNKTLNRSNKQIAAEIKSYLENLELDFIESDILEDIKDFFKDKHAKQGSKSNFNKIKDVSHEAQVTFLINHGIKIKPNIEGLQSEYLSENFKRIAFYGVEYYLRIQDYGADQKVFDFIIENHIVSVAA